MNCFQALFWATHDGPAITLLLAGIHCPLNGHGATNLAKILIHNSNIRKYLRLLPDYSLVHVSQGQNHAFLSFPKPFFFLLETFALRSFAVVLIFSLARIIIAQIVMCTRRRRRAGPENAADVAPTTIDDVSKEMHANPTVADDKKESHDHSDLENATENSANELELQPTPLKTQNKESAQEIKPPELLDGLRALVDKAQMVSTGPFFPKLSFSTFISRVEDKLGKKYE